jgi:hypothetical protein
LAKYIRVLQQIPPESCRDYRRPARLLWARSRRGMQGYSAT